MTVITPFFDVVAGVAILAGRSSLLDTGVFKTANTNFTIRHLLALGFIGVGVWNLWKIERAQDKLKKSLGAESCDDLCIQCEWCDTCIDGVCENVEEEWGRESADFDHLCRQCHDEHIEELGMNAESFGAESCQHEWRKVNYGQHPKRFSHVWLCDKCNARIDSINMPSENRKVRPNSYTRNWKWPKQSYYFGAEPMFVESDSLMVELMGFDGSYRTDGEVKMGYTTAAELGFEPKELKPVMWVWDDIEGYGAFMPSDKIRFI
tara:strand:- start:2210 stop:2998 length:789 start_codon:yes stop_codon:yes gene_type:complete